MEFDKEDFKVEMRAIQPSCQSLLAQPIHYIRVFLFLHARSHAALLQASPDLCLIRVSAAFFRVVGRGEEITTLDASLLFLLTMSDHKLAISAV